MKVLRSKRRIEVSVGESVRIVRELYAEVLRDSSLSSDEKSLRDGGLGALSGFFCCQCPPRRRSRSPLRALRVMSKPFA